MTDPHQGNAAAILARTKRTEIQHFADGGSLKRTTHRVYAPAAPTGAAALLGQLPPSHSDAKSIEHGGPVQGPGTPTSDSVPLWGSTGEFMLPADTTAAVGKDRLQALVDATHTPTTHPAEKKGRAARADGGPIDDPGAVTRTGNAYSGGNVLGNISVNGQAPGGTVSTVDPDSAAARLATPTPAAVAPVPSAGTPVPASTSAVPAPAAAPLPSPGDYANRNSAFNAGADARTALASQSFTTRRPAAAPGAAAPAPAAPAAPTAAAPQPDPGQMLFGYADGGVVVDPRKVLAGGATALAPAAQPAPTGTDLIGRRPMIDMGMADRVQPAQLAAPPAAAPVATQQTSVGPARQTIGRRPPINMGMAEVVPPAQVQGPPAATATAQQQLARPAPGAPAAPSEAPPRAASAAAGVLGPAAALGGISGAAQSMDDLSSGYRDQFQRNLGVETPLGSVGADALRVLGNVGDAATLGLAGKVGRGIASATSGQGFLTGFSSPSERDAYLAAHGRGAASPPASAPPAAAAAPAAPAATTPDANAVLGAAPPAPESFQGAGTVTQLPMAADVLGQIKRDTVHAQEMAALRNPNDPTPGLAVINPDYANRNAKFNEDADLRLALAHGSWSPRKGFQGDQTAVAGALAPVQARAQAAQATQKDAGETLRTQIAARGAEARAKLAEGQQAQANDIARQRLAIDATRAGQAGVPAGYQRTATGNLTFIPGGPADPNTPKGKNNLTDTQAKALQFGSRMQSAEETLGQMAAQGVNQPGLIKRGADAVGLGGIANWTQSDQEQQVEQAQRDFINAALRRESGAAIAESEFANARNQYFPQAGDSAKVIAQKKANRDLATRGILAEVPDGATRVAAVRNGLGTMPAPTTVGATGQLEAPRAVARTGTVNGRRVVQYADGSVDYAD